MVPGNNLGLASSISSRTPAVYLKTSREQHPGALNTFMASSMDDIIGFDAFGRPKLDEEI